MQNQTAVAQTFPAPVANSLTHRLPAQVMLVLGLGLTGAWISFLGYELVTLLLMAL